MRRSVFLPLVLVLAFVSGAHAQLLNLVMPNAEVVGGANVSTAKLSPFGSFLLTKLESAGDPGLSTLIEATGFNPLTDVSQVLFASGDPTKHSAFVAALGNFDPAKIATAIPATADVTTGTYGGATIFTFTSGKEKTSESLAFIGTTLAIAGDTADVQGAIDRNGTSNSLPAGLSQATTLSQNDDVWLVSDASLSAILPASVTGNPSAGMAAQFLKSIQSVQAAVKFGETTQASVGLTEDTAQNAEALGNVVRLLISMGANQATGQTGQNAELGAILGLLKGATVATNGNTVAISLAIPEAQLESIVNGHPAGN